MFQGICWRICLLVVLSLLGIMPELGFPQEGNQSATAPGESAQSSIITASGTVEPEETVEVNSNITGHLKAFGKDADGKAVDRRSNVEEGAVLAVIDDAAYANDVVEAQAQLEISQAEAQQAQAKQPLDAPAVDRAKACVKLAQVHLARAKMNLDSCTIRSPIKGLVIDRRVMVGQSVVSPPSAPSLFLIARSPMRLQVWADVEEKDIPRIQVGQSVTFIVDALPHKNFRGTVGKVRLDATMAKGGAVRYPVEIFTSYRFPEIYPYMTATVKFEPAAGK